MKKGSVMALRGSRGKIIYCRNGTIWLTAPNTIKDIILKQGDSYRIPTYKKIVLQAMLECSIEIK